MSATWSVQVTVQPAILSKLKHLAQHGSRADRALTRSRLAEEEELDEDDQHCEEAVRPGMSLHECSF